jgi:tetratricopeptide (TPR) repeat protein
VSKRSYALLVAATLAAYAWAPWSGFVWDDHHVIEHGRLIQSLTNVPRLYAHDTMFNSDGGVFATAAAVDTYRPLTMTTLFVDRAIFGVHAAGFHVTSVLVHLGCVLLTFALAMAIGLRERAALLAAAIFAVHPAISEAVHWIDGRSDPLCVLFFLAALLAWLRGRLVACAALFFLATLCKETAFLLAPAVLTLSSRRVRAQSTAAALAPWLAGGAVGLALRLVALHRTAVAASAAHVGYAIERLPALWLDGLISLVVPTAQMPASLFERYQQVAPARTAIALVVMALVSALAVAMYRRRAVAPAWFVVSFAASLAPIALLAADEGWFGWGRYLYPAAPMFAVAVVEVGDQLTREVRARVRSALAVAAVVIVILCAAQTFAAARDWRDDRAFATAMLADHPESSAGWSELAVVELQDHHPERAAELASRAVEIAPRNGRGWSRLATALMQLGRRADAFAAADRALALDPGDVNGKYVLAIRRLGERKEADAAVLLVEVIAKEPEQQGPWQTLEQAARHLGASSEFVRTVAQLSAEPRYAAVAQRIREALPR